MFQSEVAVLTGQRGADKQVAMKKKLIFGKKDLGKAQRITIVLKLLVDGRWLSANRIANIMGVSQRTVYRDINDLKDIEVPIRYSKGKYNLDKIMWDAWSLEKISQAID